MVTAVGMIIAAILGSILVSSKPTYYYFSSLTPMKKGYAFIMGVSSLDCALQCFSDACVRFVHSQDDCILHDDWEIESVSVNNTETMLGMEYKMRDLCPNEFYYNKKYHQCYYIKPGIFTTWIQALDHCPLLHPSAHLVIVENYPKALVLKNYLMLKYIVKNSNSFWTAGYRVLNSTTNSVTPYAWKGLSKDIPFTEDIFWQVGRPRLNNTFNCITVGRVKVGLTNHPCYLKKAFVCQVNAIL